MKKSHIYTRGGDEGMTSLVGGKRVSKADLRVEAYGTIDELNAQIGLLVALLEQSEICVRLLEIQGDLFTLGAYLATDTESNINKEGNQIEENDVIRLERYIDETEEGLPGWKGFSLPGGSLPASICHVCRTVCRRAERRIIELSATETISPVVCKYVNRLSDYFFVLSRRLLFDEGKEEIIWKKRC